MIVDRANGIGPRQPERRPQAEHHRRERGEGHRGDHHPEVQRRLQGNRHRHDAGHAAQEERRAEVGGAEAGYATGERQDESFGEQLPDQTAAAAADRLANRKLAAAAHTVGEHHRRRQASVSSRSWADSGT